jgi:putative ABC transport system permease protein
MQTGTFFDWSAVRNAGTYIVVGPTVAKELELGNDPVGQVVRMNGVPLVVIGMTKEKGGAGLTNSDDMVFMPITTLQKRVMGSRFPNSVPQVVLKLTDGADNAIAVEQITGLLRERHRLKDTDADDFQITDMKQIMDTMNTVTGFLKMLLMAIASVSLLVGSIGIMNMMLVSVAERTREIGIRKAIGARESHITIQFLSEAILISFMGSMIGFVLGVILSQTVLPGVMDMEIPLSIWSVFLSVGVAVVVGIASGVMPARKAAKLHPIDALRYE